MKLQQGIFTYQLTSSRNHCGAGFKAILSKQFLARKHSMNNRVLAPRFSVSSSRLFIASLLVIVLKALKAVSGFEEEFFLNNESNIS